MLLEQTVTFNSNDRVYNNTVGVSSLTDDQWKELDSSSSNLDASLAGAYLDTRSPAVWSNKALHCDSHNPRHDYLFKRRKDNDTSVLSAIDQPDAFKDTSALSLGTLRSSQKRVPRETQRQQGEERETNTPPEEENHDMLDAQGNESRTTSKNELFKFPEGKEPRWNKCKLKREKFNGKSIDEALNSRPTIILEDQ
ncbi:hypothetical protein Cgig2_006295 [Carnegiea gigantea]|uniref:Uncharacterized protein n=1 Tax=Carnegiea gigantea TaxID=171969 RepID=A0A9Q1K8P1_9CARY|nr:hypothetical protein Cgig2_006295 [Carnegiea gigantea]